MAIVIPNLSEGEYRKGLEERYKNFYKIIEKNFPNLWEAVEVCGSIYCLLFIEDVSLPLALFLLGDPSSKKTTCLSIFEKLERAYKSDKFSPKSFVSHASNIKKEKLEEIDLLPRIKNKLFITPELATIFGVEKEELLENIAIITRILDGQGFISDSGVHGRRGYVENIFFVWLGAIVEIPERAWKIMGNLGSRLYFFRMKSKKYDEDEAIIQLKKEDYMKRLEECREACERYLKWLTGKGSIKWNKENDPDDVLRVIIRVARLLTRLRAVINIRESFSIDESEYDYASPVIENSDRVEYQLYNLARGHAFFSGRKQISKDDLPIVINVALSSASKERVRFLEFLLNNNGEATTSQFVVAFSCSRKTALRIMKELVIIGLVDEIEVESKTKPQKAIKLKEEFGWFLSDEFKELRYNKHRGDFWKFSFDKIDETEKKIKTLEINGEIICSMCKHYHKNTCLEKNFYLIQPSALYAANCEKFEME